MNINDRWETGLENETKFWQGWIEKNCKDYPTNTKLRDYFGELIGDKEEVSILDVGAGAASTIGYTWPNVKVNITFTDVLAENYKKIFDSLSIKQPNMVEYQDMLDLTYNNNTFDIVNCRNALDHCIDPIKAIHEMVRACKPGGWVYLAHFSHEGKRRNYHGLHQWNLDGLENGDCRIWNKENSYLLSEIQPGFVTNFVCRKLDGLQMGVSNKLRKEVYENPW